MAAGNHRRAAGRKAVILVAMMVAPALLLAPLLREKSPVLFWNASPSVPIGTYWVRRAPPRVGDLVLVRLAGTLIPAAHRRRYLPRTAYLLKPVSAAAGDRVCRIGLGVFVRGRWAALALAKDSVGRPMPAWQGCRTLQRSELFLLAPHPASFDSRYFGPISAEHVAGRAERLWPAAPPTNMTAN